MHITPAVLLKAHLLSIELLDHVVTQLVVEVVEVLSAEVFAVGWIIARSERGDHSFEGVILSCVERDSTRSEELRDSLITALSVGLSGAC